MCVSFGCQDILSFEKVSILFFKYKYIYIFDLIQFRLIIIWLLQGRSGSHIGRRGPGAGGAAPSTPALSFRQPPHQGLLCGVRGRPARGGPHCQPDTLRLQQQDAGTLVPGLSQKGKPGLSMVKRSHEPHAVPELEHLMQDSASPQSSHFERDLADYLAALKLPAPYDKKARQLCAAHDFSGAAARLVASVPGSHTGKTYFSLR